LKKVFTKCRKWYIINASDGKTTDRKAVDTMDEKEVVGMTDKQFETVLKQILLYAKKAENKEEIIKYLEEMMADDKKA